MDRYQIALGKNRPGIGLTNYILDQIKTAKCPLCGDRIYLPQKGFDQLYKETDSDPIVFCKRSKSHWTGHLSDTEHKL